MRVFDDWHLTAERVAIHVPTATAVLADLHLGYAAARQRRGEAVPARALSEILAPLAAVMQRFECKRIVIAGDLLEDGVDVAVIADLIAWLKAHALDMVAIVPGNHDRRLKENPQELPVVGAAYGLGPWQVVHGDRALPAGPVVLGHFHPCVQLGPYLRPCYLAGSNRLVLPAYSCEARGAAAEGNQLFHGMHRLVPVGAEVLDFGTLPGGLARARPLAQRRRYQ